MIKKKKDKKQQQQWAVDGTSIDCTIETALEKKPPNIKSVAAKEKQNKKEYKKMVSNYPGNLETSWNIEIKKC